MTEVRTFVFADIAGFTALTEAHGDEEAADLAGRFAGRVRADLPATGRLVKCIGDALMLAFTDAGDAVRAGLRITGELMNAHGSPTVRVGMHTGPAVHRDGDWWGACVNIAARVSAEAAGGEVLLTDTTLEAAGELDGVRVHDRGRRRLRHVSRPQRLFTAESEHAAARRMVLDPVCRMAVDREQAVAQVRHRGSTLRFCSLGCVRAFAGDPDAFLTGPTGPPMTPRGWSS